MLVLSAQLSRRVLRAGQTELRHVVEVGVSRHRAILFGNEVATAESVPRGAKAPTRASHLAGVVSLLR